MKTSETRTSSPILLLVAGAKGAVGSTLAAAVSAGREDPDVVSKSLTTHQRFSSHFPSSDFRMAGWDTCLQPYPEVWEKNGILPEAVQRRCRGGMEVIQVRNSPDPHLSFKDQVGAIQGDITDFKGANPGAWPVFVNLLPAAPAQTQAKGSVLASTNAGHAAVFPDMAYAWGAVESGIPVINFTPNAVESSELLSAARENRIPMAGRDGKTGQTYLKVVLASALKARAFGLDGWYSLNLLGNADGQNLMIPENASGKLANKTAVLDAVLGNPGADGSGSVFHKVRIDYYPPRGDAKEAWDVIDFHGLFGLPMSLRVNLLGRDSILAAPLVLDLARWMAVLTAAGHVGAVPRLGFYFKTPMGEDPPLAFQDQLAALDTLERDCMESIDAHAGQTP